jgi:predicted Zn-dependent protease
MLSFTRTVLFVLSLSVLLSQPALVAAQNIALPEIGDSSGALVTPTEEIRTGEAVVRNIRRMGGILDDPLTNDYLNNLGFKLVSHSDTKQRHFEFFMVNDGGINAFALPGGYIGINYGLFLATESENELASVIAHETAHVTQRHHARAYERAKNQSIPVMAALLAAIILGSQGSQIGSAAMGAISAGSAQEQINFTRSNEKEADYVGIQLLADSGFNPNGMADFFEKMDRESRLYGSGPPEFLRTHPVTQSRISDASSRASQYPVKSNPSTKNYYLVRMRLMVLESQDKSVARKRLERSLATGSYLDRDATVYGLALTQIETRQYDKARKNLDALLNKDPNRIAYLLARAELESTANNHKQALARYKKAIAVYPGNVPLTYGYVHALLKADEPAQARDVIQTHLRIGAQLPAFYRLLAESESRLGDKASSQVALGEYYYRIGQTFQAIDQFKLALKNPNLDFYNTARIEARLTEFKQEMAELAALEK